MKPGVDPNRTSAEISQASELGEAGFNRWQSTRPSRYAPEPAKASATIRARDCDVCNPALLKVLMVAAIALLASLVTFGNLTDYGINLAFVGHVLSIDTIFPFSKIGYRAITSVELHQIAYVGIIAMEAATAFLCWIGAGLLVRHIRTEARIFNRAKTVAVAGLTLGFLLWQVGFMTIGGEWFGMWQSKDWNGVPSAFRFVMVIAAVLIFVALPDGDLTDPSTRDGRARNDN